MGRKDLKVLLLLMENPRGLYGSELVARSDKELSRASIYTQLGRLVEKGLVEEINEDATPELQMPRTRHKITAQGVRSLQEFLNSMNLASTKFAMEGLAHG